MSSQENPAYRRISAAEAVTLLAADPAPTIFDVRDMASFRKGHLAGAAQLAEDRFLLWQKRLDKAAPVLIYCYHGNASQVFAQMFVDFRFTDVYSVDGGYEALAVVAADRLAA